MRHFTNLMASAALMSFGASAQAQDMSDPNIAVDHEEGGRYFTADDVPPVP